MRFSKIPTAFMRLMLVPALLLLLMAVSTYAQMGDENIKIRERIMRFKMTRLIDVLDMDEATAEKFFVRYNLAQNAVRSAQQALDSVINELDKAVMDNNHARIKELTELSLRLHNELQSAIAEVFRSVRPVLSEEQYARFLIFEARFHDEVKKRLMERRGRGDRDDSQGKQRKRDRDDD